MTPEENKARYRAYIQAIFNEARFDELDGFLAPGYVIADAPPVAAEGAAGIREVVTMFHDAFPDIEITLDEVVAEGDTVAARSTLRGTHRGPFLGVAPTGKTVEVVSLTLVHFTEGRLTASWVKNDIAGLLRQLGAA